MRHTNTFMRVWVFGLPGVIALLGCNAILGVEKAELDETIGKAGGAQGGAAGTAGQAGQAGGGTAGQGGEGGTAGTSGTGGTAGTAGGGGTGGTAGTSGTAGGGGAGGCEPGTTTCRDTTTPQYCDSNRVWQNLPTCAYVCINGACGGECSPLSKQCLGNTPQQCLETGMGWVNLAECPAVCKNGECVGACAPNTDKQCVGNISMVCNSMGNGWEPNPAFPPNGECPFACLNGNCVGECKPGDSPRCNPSNPKEVQFCNKDGKWTFQQLCVDGCDAGECIQPCLQDSVRCKPGSTNIVERCVNNIWEYVSDCPNACFNGKCVDCYASDVRCDPNNPDNIQKCDASSHTWAPSTWCGANLTCSGGMCVGTGCVEGSKRCLDGKNSQETCIAGVWQPETCPAGSTCTNNVCGPCTTGFQQCQSDNLTLWVCIGGSWQEQLCAGTCSNNACVDCIAGTVQCLDSANEQNCVNGTWVTKPCASTEICTASSGCTPTGICTPGERGCNGNSPQLCNAFSQWDIAAPCSGLSPTCKDGFCVCNVGVGSPDTVPIGPDYCIDRTEVTRGQYEQWAASTPPPTAANQIAECAWNDSFLPPSTCLAAGTVCTGANCLNHPQVCVDWCDAYAFCKAMGKRLCGRVAGGSTAVTEVSDVGNSWYNACSAGGVNLYGYGYPAAPEPNTCNGQANGQNTTVPVGSMSGCHGPPPSQDVYDLSGNVVEWVDSCEAHVGENDRCAAPGGGYMPFNNADLRCDVAELYARNVHWEDVGFRCCSKTNPQVVTTVKQFGNGNLKEDLIDLVAFPDGSAVATGVHVGTLTIDGKSASAPSSVLWATFAARFDAQGNAVWVKSVGGTIKDNNQDYLPTHAITGLPDGSVLVAGAVQGSVNFDGSANSFTADGESDMFVAKFAPNDGHVVFVVHNTGGNAVGGQGDFAMDVSAVDSASFAVVGEYGGTAYFDAANGLTCSSGKQCGFVARYETLYMAPKWVRSSGTGSPGTPGSDIARAVLATTSAVYVAYTYTSDPFVPDMSQGLALPLNGAARNAALAKFDLNGALVWAKRIQGGAPGGVVYPIDLREMPDGRIVMFGSYGLESAGPAVSPTFGPGESGERQLAAVGNNGRASFVALFDPGTGDLTGARRIGAPPGATGGGTIRGAPVSDGSLLIASTFNNPDPFVLGQGESNETALPGGATNDRRALFARFNWDGTLNWAQSINSDGVFNDIAANFYPSSPGVFVGGATLRAPVTITVGGTPTTYTSGANMFLLWYGN